MNWSRPRESAINSCEPKIKIAQYRSFCIYRIYFDNNLSVEPKLDFKKGVQNSKFGKTFFRTKNGMLCCHLWVNTNKNSYVHSLLITDIEDVIGDNNFSLLLNVFFRFPIKIFFQNKITEIRTNTSLMLIGCNVSVHKWRKNVSILKIFRNKKNQRKWNIKILTIRKMICHQEGRLYLHLAWFLCMVSKSMYEFSNLLSWNFEIIKIWAVAKSVGRELV